VSTNKEGVYAIKIQKGDVLTFSYKGMISQKITVTNDSQINVTLKKDSNLTEEIIEAKVPVNQSKKPLIVIDGKISSLTIEDLDENNIYSMSVIKGKTAQDKYGDKGDDGVIEITTKKNETITVIGYKNDINKTVKIKSEDGKEPLIVIDGKVSAKKVDDLAPDDIQSINVLKGETAQDKYGDKGNDGVIEITLKKK
jgi:bla regulator protein BlaR1